MRRRTVRNVAAAAAVLVFIGGAALAAVAATARSGAHGAGHARHARRHVVLGELDRAAAYLGVSPARLKGALASGRTLAQIANATPGRSEAGLVAALVSAGRTKLDAQAARLPQAVEAEVNRPGGPGAPGRGALFIARAYLGLSASQLRNDRRAGRTLAQIAEATPGRSRAGLIRALVSAKQEQLAAALAAGRLGKAQEQARAARLTAQVSALVARRPDAERPAGRRDPAAG